MVKITYLLKGFWEKDYTEVTEKQYIDAQKKIGEWEPGGTTTFFEKHGISGKATIEEE